MKKLLLICWPVPGGAGAAAGHAPRCRWMSPRAMSSRCPSPFPIMISADPPRPRWAPISPAWCAPIWNAPACSSPIDPQGLCRAHHQHQCRAHLRQLARHQRAGPGGGAGDACSPMAGCRSNSGCGTSMAKARCWASNSSPSRRIGGASPIWCPTRSMSASPARRAISTPASSSSRNPGPAIKRVKRLAVMDEDGANPIFLTHGDYLVLTPRFNPTAQMIAYMSYIGTKPRVYLFDLETGKQEDAGQFPQHDLLAALLARRQPRGADPGERRQFRHLCDGSAHRARCSG